MGTPAKKETHTHTLNSTTLAHITHADRLTANLPKISHTSRKLTEFPPVKRNKKKRLQTLSKNPRAPATGGNSSSFHLLRPHNPKFFPVKIAESATKHEHARGTDYIPVGTSVREQLRWPTSRRLRRTARRLHRCNQRDGKQ